MVHHFIQGLNTCQIGRRGRNYSKKTEREEDEEIIKETEDADDPVVGGGTRLQVQPNCESWRCLHLNNDARRLQGFTVSFVLFPSSILSGVLCQTPGAELVSRLRGGVSVIDGINIHFGSVVSVLEAGLG